MKTISTIGLAVLCALPWAQLQAETNSGSKPGTDGTTGCTLEVSLTATNDCAAGGSIVSSVTGGVAPFAYLWSDGSTEQSLLNAPTGFYSLTLVDANGCGDTVTAEIDLTDNLAHNAVTTVATCGVSGGSVQTFVNGGTAPYTYEWSNGETDSDIAGLVPGVYSVTVTDANGCSLTDTFTVSSGTTINVIQSVVGDTCSGGNGSVSISINGGVFPYSFEWSNGATSSTIIDLDAGTYFVTITDSIGCVATASSVVENVPPPICNINVINANCDSAGGTAILLCAGGTPPYSFAWSNGETDGQADGLTMGLYTVTITDAAGCISIDTADVLQSGNPPVATYTVINPDCGDENGSIDVSISGGATPYNLIWSNGETTEDLDSVTAGVYSLTVTAANGCLAVVDVTVSAAGACSAPSSADALVTTNSATITWESVPCAVKYRVRVKKLGAQGGPWMTYVVLATDTSYTISGLVPGAIYKYRVRSQCSPDGSVLSPFTASQYFTVPAGVTVCEAPAGVVSSNVTMDGATISWSPVAGSYGYRLRYRIEGTPGGWTPVVINNGNMDSYTVSGLQAGTTYEFQVSTKCEVGPTAYSTFSKVASFTTLTQRLGGMDETTMMSVYPNPAINQLTVRISSDLTDANITMYNAVGQIVKAETQNVNSKQIELDVQSLSPGVYIIEVQNESIREYARFVKE